MWYEHVNTANEIEIVLRHFFTDVKMSLLGISKNMAFIDIMNGVNQLLRS